MMLLNVIIILAITAYVIYDVYLRRDRLTCMAGMMIAMTVGMMVSISIGVLLGVYFNHDLTKSTILSVVVGIFTGYLAGKPVSLMASMDGMLGGIMGGMMGSMLGVMLVFPTSMVWFVNIIFAAVMFVLIQLIDEETTKEKRAPNEGKKPLLGSSGMLVGGIALEGLLLFINPDVFETIQASSTSENTIQSDLLDVQGNVQQTTINVTPDGYGPANIELKAGIPAKINFKTEAGAGCLRQVISNELGINSILSQEGDNYITIKGLKPGTYRYTCGMGMFGGTITVK